MNVVRESEHMTRSDLGNVWYGIDTGLPTGNAHLRREIERVPAVKTGTDCQIGKSVSAPGTILETQGRSSSGRSHSSTGIPRNGAVLAVNGK
jgi:hypothetical protein